MASLLLPKAKAQEAYVPSEGNLQTRQWFQDAKFGLFIHWGVYSVMGGGGENGIAEWIMQHKKMPISAYEKLPQLFNPTQFDAKEWVSMAKNAGMKYITITSKHHDGFAMYDSKVSDYDIVDSTPYGKDIIRQLEEECEKQGIKLFLYYSQLDWHHTDYYPRGRTGKHSGRPDAGNWEDYLTYQNAQIKELAENYNITGFWFDGWWDQAPTLENESQKEKLINPPEWNLKRTYNIIHGVNPSLLIGNNHHIAPFEGEDFQMFEKDLPGENTTGFGSSPEDIGQLPLETCETINGSWGFNIIDNNHKSVEDLIKYVVNAAGRDTNFLLNVGPMPNGKIQPEHIHVLQEMGDWMSTYGATIYGTRGGPSGLKDHYVTTQKGKTTYFHILNKGLKQIAFTPEAKMIKIVRFDTQEPVKYRQSKGKVTFDVPFDEKDIVTTVEVVVK